MFLFLKTHKTRKTQKYTLKTKQYLFFSYFCLLSLAFSYLNLLLVTLKKTNCASSLNFTHTLGYQHIFTFIKNKNMQFFAFTSVYLLSFAFIYFHLLLFTFTCLYLLLLVCFVCFLKKENVLVPLITTTNFTGKNLCWSIFLIKLQFSRPATLLKKTPTQLFPCEFVNYSRALIL